MSSLHSRCAFALAAALSASAFGCSAAPDSDDVEDVDADEAALGALPAASIVGTVTFGDAFKTIDYTKTPRYRALRLQGTAGDTIKVRIKSSTPGTRSIGWLLGANYRTIKQTQGDAVTATGDTYFEAELTKTGTYYVALRESAMRDAAFAVQVRRVGAQAADPFDPASCSGAPLDSNELRDLLGTTQERKLGRYEIEYRERSCTTAGCAAWAPGVAAERNNCSGRSGSYTFPGCNLPGDLKLTYAGSGFQVSLGYSPQSGGAVVDNHMGAMCTFQPTGELACDAYGFKYHVDTSDFCRIHVCNGESYNHAFLELGDRTTGQPAATRHPKLRGHLKPGCFQATATMGGQLGQTQWTETQAAVLVRF